MLADVRHRLIAGLDTLAWLWPLLIRLTVGTLFTLTGWQAANNLDDVTSPSSASRCPGSMPCSSRTAS
jgi:hypothetical protein